MTQKPSLNQVTHNKVFHYVRHDILAPNGLLVTTGDQQYTYSPWDPKTKIIVPHHVAAGLLYYLPNNVSLCEHLTLCQLPVNKIGNLQAGGGVRNCT